LANKREKTATTTTGGSEQLEQLARRVKMLDDRLDNLDSIVTSLVQRVMEKPLTLEIHCPKCGSQIELGITSNARLRGGI
jgi:hypothetical protein